jgi:hypothetical protein
MFKRQVSINPTAQPTVVSVDAAPAPGMWSSKTLLTVFVLLFWGSTFLSYAIPNRLLCSLPICRRNTA